MALVIAAADIGSNTAHLLVAEVTDGKLRRLVNESEWLSLGEVVSRTGEIPRKDVLRLLDSMDSFMRLAQANNADQTYIFATEAMRQAKNHDEVLQEIKRKTGLDVDIVTARRETEFSLRAVAMDSPGPDPFLLVEMGGGSLQIALCKASRVLEGVSAPIGTGALLARTALEQPPSPEQIVELGRVIRDALDPVDDMGAPRRVVAAGGVARGIWRALHPDLDRVIAIQELEHLAWDTARLTSAQITARYGVKQKRAQTLLPGATAFAAVLRLVGQPDMTVSEFGVREGAILEMAGA